MRYYKQIEESYLVSIGEGYGFTEITEEEYKYLDDVINNKPTPPEGYDYRLKTDLTWELCELPPEPPAPEPQPSQDWLDGYDQAILDMMEVQ